MGEPSTWTLKYFGKDQRLASEVTGISDVAADGEAAEGSYYNLQGQRMGDTPAQRGAYIVNGKKVVVK